MPGLIPKKSPSILDARLRARARSGRARMSTRPELKGMSPADRSDN